MAKKVIATLQKAGSKNLSKVISAVRSPKTGAYSFKEEIVPNEAVQEVLARKA
jgi:hypothetical protein